MKKSIILISIFLPILLAGQQPIIIDHSCIDLAQIPNEWIESAKENLHIGYGHTSHGSHLPTGMDALNDYYTDGTYAWSHDGGAGELHLFEGAGYESGYLRWDLDHAVWPDETRTYLNDHPGCNVIIWSWCGGVNNVVDLISHYLGPMEQLESEYPDVQFVYMTGHLEGEGIGGSLQLANNQIRNYCIQNNKILYDFADIEKYSPDADTNFQEYFANDACDYNHPNGGTANWAIDWLAANPGDTLTQISQICEYCSHSEKLNCTKKGIAAWFLWARLAGWEGPTTIIEKKNPQVSSFNNIQVFPNPASHEISIVLPVTIFCKKIEIWDMNGKSIFSKLVNEDQKELVVSNISIPTGMYVVKILSDKQVYKGKVNFY